MGKYFTVSTTEESFLDRNSKTAHVPDQKPLDMTSSSFKEQD